jgi:ABC-2 type transport system permease protein
MQASPAQESFVSANFSIVWNEVVKNIKNLLAYPAIIVFWAVFPVFWFIPFILQGQAFVGGLESQSFAEIAGTGNYIQFIIIGAILNSYVNTLLHGMGENIRRELYQGTLDYILASPCNKAYVLIGKAISESLSSTIFAASQLALSAVLFGMQLTVGVIVPVFFTVILLILGLYGMSLMLTAVSLTVKQSYDVAESLGYLFYIFAPVRYPIESLPSWAQIISRILPLTYALIIVRGFLLLGADFSTIYLEVIVLIIIDVILLVGGFYLFNWIEKKTKKSGTISHY